ncbi:putative capsid protein 4 [Acanthamoeba castellanii mimivirus]|uniref:Probable capsid protein 4 n=5 Tax=Mimivirus TaxID=315393 RepID=CAPS4_MIMIV|nr:probable capsid protein 4 [Acanthamoeba polyphaga mimivirus]Q7T6Y5.2 RecName: Full=Probable capsid protein 4 [Acanthamoeba polyphaga mimivirus]AEQ60627.1 Capsid protein [Acanthamoeba castellanii mamavirus]AHA45418.1 putative capsid protein 4 [Hirudovirus strain Sangsue]AHJ40127.2 capsid protein 4 [Samba virus]ALR84031.1 capsid protein [Niemeyer virus]AMZ02885.1 putative capsid protein 4 [Mimivirus Bombay]EJN40877.1 capsid protein [Acanthamoeba polyphaga lentillevirus]BAV61545.1 putative 
MAGGIIQLVAYGIQDLYLTGDPQITFFKVVYRRHTNFSVESIIQNFTSVPDFGSTVSCTLSKSGDMINKIYVYIELPSVNVFYDESGNLDKFKKFAWVRNIGYALIKDVSIEIGGKLIDKQYGEWMYIWSQVTNKSDEGLDKMIGNIPLLYDFSNGKPKYSLYVPLEFWFCRNSGLSLPLVALSSSEVKITISFRSAEECYRIGPTHSIEIMEDIVPFEFGDYIEQKIGQKTIHGLYMGYDYMTKKLYYIKIHSPTAIKKSFESQQLRNSTSQRENYRIYNSLTGSYCTPKPDHSEMSEPTELSQKLHFINAYLYVDYVYLDNDERMMLIKNPQEYLIEQIQYNQEINVKNSNVKQKLTLNHPCKAHYWVVQSDSLVGPGTINDVFNFTTSHIRNHDGRTIGENPVTKSKLMLNSRERFKQRDGKYFNIVQPYQHHYRGPDTGINMYSVSINSQCHQPSSTINMSRIDDISMEMQLKNVNPNNTHKIRSYTTSYNILRVCFNIGGLAFESMD